jgi:hypothetical protein
MIMAKQKIKGLSASLLEHTPDADPRATSAPAGLAPEPARPVVQTVKVPPDVFVKLKTVGAHERRSSQDIILAALKEYLERFPLAS